MILLHACQLAGYYATLMLFAAGGIGFTLYCLLAGLLPGLARNERHFQRVIHWLFAFVVGWARSIRLLRVDYEGMDQIPSGGCVLVANHPGLMDIVYLLARFPEAVSVFKPAIRNNPILGAGARRAGYIGSDSGPDLVRDAGEKAAAGGALIIFPEGTRTPPGIAIGPLRPGFVLIARRAGVPIQLVCIAWNTNVLVKGRAWWKLPRLPGQVNVKVGPLVTVTEGESTGDVSTRIETWFREAIAAHTPSR
ncbi:MAG TPA: lysophospholipid acyltransferase family protein [Opitutaceae bacterium]